MLRSRIHEEEISNSRPLKIVFFYHLKGQRCLFQLGMMPISVQLFGDYMTPPPAEKQVPHHDAIIADMDKSYTEYKGEYGG